MTEIEVHLAGQLVGTAHFHRGNSLSTTFLYDQAYISSGGVNIDPAFTLDTGAQYVPGIVRAFADSSPDRWGRNIIVRAERARARDEERAARTVDEVGFLLGVSDDTRQGALRFRRPAEDAFLGGEARVPKLVELPTLLRRSDELAQDEDPREALKALLDTGSTGLGGARPKASVRLDDGSLAIAKFPHGSDEWDVMAWEATTLELLARTGIEVPESRLERLGERSVLLLRRFDRDGAQRRIGYISAMTATQSSDGDRRDYADIADAIRDISPRVKADHAELFTRVISNVALGNTDDHLRNHGFLLRDGGWVLSPSFDVNPNPDLAKRRSTSIAGADHYEDEVEGLLAFANDCGLDQNAATALIANVAAALGDWEDVARRNGIPEREIALMAESIEPRRERVAAAGTKTSPIAVAPARAENSRPRRKTTAKSSPGSFAPKSTTPPDVSL